MEENVTENLSENEQNPAFGRKFFKKDLNNLYAVEPSKTPTTLRDFNAITREKLTAIESAQRKWVEDIRNQSTTDEIQKAQLEWIHKLSSMPSFNTITSPEKKNNTPWTLPFSPPRSSYENTSRRGFCVYEPGKKDISGKVKNTSGHFKDVKVAQLQEPIKVVSKTPEKTSLQFSPFPDIRSNKVDKSVRKKHITVRKKLQCMKKLEKDESAKETQNMVITPKLKSGNTPDKTEEDRQAARKYIHRKRIERDRLLREQRELEERAEKEQRARMERLKETQHRILANSVKKQPKPKLKKESWFGQADEEDEIDKLLLREMKDPPDFTGAHITGAIPFLSSRQKLNSSEKISRTTPSTPTLAGVFGWTQDENIPPPKDSSFHGSIDESTTPIRAQPASLTSISSSVKDTSSLDTLKLSSEASTPSRMKSLPLQKPLTPPLSSSRICGQFSTHDSLFPRSSLDSIHLINKTEMVPPQPILPDIGEKLLTNDVEHPTKLSEVLVNEELTTTISFDTEFVQKETSAIEKLAKTNDNFSIFSPIKMSFDSHYNLLTAISNKRSVFKDMENDCNKKYSNVVNKCDGIGHPGEISYQANEANKTEIIKVNEKGVQCHVETDEMEVDSSSYNNSASLTSSSGVKLTQSERLRKPDLILLPGRVSDPCMYTSPKGPALDVVRIDTTVSDNLNVDPLIDVAVKLSLESKRFLDQDDKIDNSQLIPGISHSTPQVELAGSRRESQIQVSDKSQIFEAIPSSLETMDSRRNVDLIKDSSKLRVSQVVTSRASVVDSPNIQKLSLEENAEPLIRKAVTSDVSLLGSSLAKSVTCSAEIDEQGDISFMSFAKFSLNMFIDLLKEESLRSKQLESHFRMRESSIIEKTKAEIAFLELEKKKFKVTGNEDGVRNVRKKIRGLIIKLQQNLEDLQLVKKMEKVGSKERRRLLLEKVDLLKEQLKKQMDTERKMKGAGPLFRNFSNSSVESKMESAKDSSSSLETRSAEKKASGPFNFELYKRDMVAQENLAAWKKSAEEGEKTIRKLEALIKGFQLSGEGEQKKMVERGTSPSRLSSDEERKKRENSLSDTFEQLSSSSQHEKLDDKDARKMIALKIPLSPRVTLKRRHSSGSDESLLLSQTETQSDASDMETRVLALQQQLKQRKAELESLHREYKKSQRERLIAKEQSLLSQIQAYDVYIEQVKTELEKGRDGPEIKVMKPVIKHPKLSCERRKSDTWLLQEKGSLKTPPMDSITEIKLLGKSKPEFSNKTGKDDKFVEKQHLHKIPVDLSAGVGETPHSRVHENLKAVSLPSSVLDDKTTGRNVDGLKIDEHPLPKVVGLPNDFAVQSNQTEEHSSSKLIKSSENQNVSSSNYNVDEKITFYEKLSEMSLSSLKTGAEPTSSPLKSPRSSPTRYRQGLCSKEQKSLSTSKSVESEGVEEDSEELKLKIFHGSSVDESSVSATETRIGKSEENEVCFKEAITDKKIIDVEENHVLEEKPDSILIESSLVNVKESMLVEVVKESSNAIVSTSSSLEVSLEKDKTSVIVSDIEGNFSEEELKEISSQVTNIVTDEYIEQSDNSSEDRVKDVSELTSIVSETEKKTDDVTRKSMDEKSFDEEIPELSSLGRVEEISKITVFDDKRSFEEVDASKEKDVMENEIEEVDELVLNSLSKQDSSIEEVMSPFGSGELSSASSFPVALVNEVIADGSVKKENSFSERDEIEDKENDQQVIESEADNERSETISHFQELSNIIEKSHLEEIKTELSESVAQNYDSFSKVGNSVKELISRQSLTESQPTDKSSLIKDGAFEEVEEMIDLDRSISESIVDASTIEEGDDSLDEQVKELSSRDKISEGEDSSSDSFLDDKDLFNLMKSERRAAAPLIDALQREGDSDVDQVWRGIADAAINDATNLVISTFMNKAHKSTSYSPQAIDHSNLTPLVGDSDDDDWNRDELQRQADEAEALRLQQLRIDKEIEELEEEEARQYYYIRPIPDKPPPPYTPRRSSLVTSVVEAAGAIWDGRTTPPSEFLSGCHIREFLWDLATELVVRVRPPSPPQQPSWVHVRRRRPKRNIRTKKELLEEVEKEAKIYLGVEERKCRENLIIRWSRKRRDHVDEILVKESQEEEWEWTDYSEEENIIKNRVADAIIQESIASATAAIAQAFVKKFKE